MWEIQKLIKGNKNWLFQFYTRVVLLKYYTHVFQKFSQSIKKFHNFAPDCDDGLNLLKSLSERWMAQTNSLPSETLQFQSPIPKWWALKRDLCKWPSPHWGKLDWISFKFMWHTRMGPKNKEIQSKLWLWCMK